MKSLSDKEVCYNNLICFPHKDVKEAIKELKKRMFEDEDPIIVIEEIFGAELCSEEESE